MQMIVELDSKNKEVNDLRKELGDKDSIINSKVKDLEQAK